MKTNSNWIEKAKKTVAEKAVEHIRDGYVVGLGSGSTAAYAIEVIGKRVREERIRIRAVPTSYQALHLALLHGLSLTSLDENPVVDLTIDGADQIDDKLNMIKGMGGALVREKIVASASKINIIVADETKKVRTLGERNHPVPVEVLPFGANIVQGQIEKIGGKPKMREGTGKVGPIITDNGNLIIDCIFGLIPNPAELHEKLKTITGVVETGLFVETADTVYIGRKSGLTILDQKQLA